MIQHLNEFIEARASEFHVEELDGIINKAKENEINVEDTIKEWEKVMREVNISLFTVIQKYFTFF